MESKADQEVRAERRGTFQAMGTAVSFVPEVHQHSVTCPRPCSLWEANVRGQGPQPQSKLLLQHDELFPLSFISLPPLCSRTTHRIPSSFFRDNNWVLPSTTSSEGPFLTIQPKADCQVHSRCIFMTALTFSYLFFINHPHSNVSTTRAGNSFASFNIIFPGLTKQPGIYQVPNKC